MAEIRSSGTHILTIHLMHLFFPESFIKGTQTTSLSFSRRHLVFFRRKNSLASRPRLPSAFEKFTPAEFNIGSFASLHFVEPQRHRMMVGNITSKITVGGKNNEEQSVYIPQIPIKFNHPLFYY